MTRAVRIVVLTGIAVVLGAAVTIQAAQAGVRTPGVDEQIVRTIAADKYVDAARTALLASLRSREGRFELQTRGTYREVIVAGRDDPVLRTRVPNVDALPTVVVWVDVVVRNRVVRHLPVYFRVSRFLPALVARARLPARVALDASLFEQREVDVAGARGGAVTEIAQLRGRRLRHELAAGDALELDAIEDRPPVEVGERIHVTAHVGRVVVHRTAIAQHDGFEGQSITATLPEGGETLRVKVVGEDRAKVQGDGWKTARTKHDAAPGDRSRRQREGAGDGWKASRRKHGAAPGDRSRRQREGAGDG